MNFRGNYNAQENDVAKRTENKTIYCFLENDREMKYRTEGGGGSRCGVLMKHVFVCES
jgi:hypothetical protein